MITFMWNPASYYVPDQYKRFLPGHNPANPSTDPGNITEYKNPDTLRFFKGGPYQSPMQMMEDYNKAQWWLTVGMAQGLPPPDGVNPFDYVTNAGIFPNAFPGTSLPHMQNCCRGMNYMCKSKMIPGGPGGPSIMPMSPTQQRLMGNMQSILGPLKLDKPCPTPPGPPPPLLD